MSLTRRQTTLLEHVGREMAQAFERDLRSVFKLPRVPLPVEPNEELIALLTREAPLGAADWVRVRELGGE